ncbi:Gfo/Idh/MocA family protein [Nocardioides marmorisolisilvae]|uniref:Gfo/Idh/MocA family oxidoreductase n=1 Tax=Nocardioides marmorisolisilvae TaxID=1542737 RepID=A0A3N0DTX3_9ACTN|nr:Gfo/Idh/MocA family oxidoreductase [Nocardioides marmorisolisilvae]RNL79060.1 gfo/Idh/MocA family oxidoreductase [Nocardioides marmorisolisilvae]
MADLRAGLVGYGQMGRNHARVLQQMAGVELVAIAEPDPPTVHAPGFAFVPDVDALIAAGIDLAVVSVPTAAHEEVALKLASAGVHTLIEKPIAPDVPTSLRIAEAFDSAGLVGCVGHIERYNPALQELKKRLKQGEIGTVYQVATRRQGPFPSRIADVGVVLDLATHDIDLTSWVTKRAYVNLSARTANRSGREHEDLVAAVGTLEDGIVVNHLVNWLSPLKERVTVVTGERGTLVADTITADLTFFANGVEPVRWDSIARFQGVVQGDVTRYAFEKREPLLVELEAFRDAVLGEDVRTVSIADAARTVAVATAMVAASASEETQTPREPD